jgi:hypothetical protein
LNSPDSDRQQIQFASTTVAQASARAAKIMGRQFG